MAHQKISHISSVHKATCHSISCMQC